MFDEILASLNWLTLAATFGAAGLAYTYAAEKKWPRFTRYIFTLIAFIALATSWFFLYHEIGFPGWMRWPTQLLASNSHGQQFVKQGFYSVDSSGWQHNTIPDGDVFTCSTCDAQAQIQISYGPELKGDVKYSTNQEFLAALSTEQAQREFADSILRGSIPLQSGFTISIEKIGLSDIGGLNVIEFSAIVDMPPNVSHENSMLAIHKNRMMKLSLNYFDDGMDDKTRAATNRFYKSFRFF